MKLNVDHLSGIVKEKEGYRASTFRTFSPRFTEKDVKNDLDDGYIWKLFLECLSNSIGAAENGHFLYNQVN